MPLHPSPSANSFDWSHDVYHVVLLNFLYTLVVLFLASIFSVSFFIGCVRHATTAGSLAGQLLDAVVSVASVELHSAEVSIFLCHAHGKICFPGETQLGFALAVAPWLRSILADSLNVVSFCSAPRCRPNGSCCSFCDGVSCGLPTATRSGIKGPSWVTLTSGI